VRVVLAGSLALGGALTAVLIGGALPASAAATVIQTMPVGTNPSGVSSDGTHVWVTNLNSNTVSELDASTGSVIQTIGLGAYYGPSGVSSDGTHVWVADQGVATVTELNASTGSVVQTIGVGTYPYSVSSDGTHVWVANQGSNTVTEISIVGFTITTSSLPNATPGVAYGPVTLQAANRTVSTSPYTTALKWKKVTGPRGLKLSSAGVLSGTPTARLQAGPSSVAVQVTETVTTLNGKKKVKTLSTVQATIPLTIT
jgi:YVTN family beta-propeller protein